jgi:hypothetical protein
MKYETTSEAAGISRRWRATFGLEIPLCGATVAYWVFAPDQYARRMFGNIAFGVGDRYLVLQSASLVAALFVWLYGRVLLAPSIDLRTFCYLQEAMAIGDAGILALSGYLALAAHPDPGTLIAQAIVASFWGGLRLVFLYSHRKRAVAGYTTHITSE